MAQRDVCHRVINGGDWPAKGAWRWDVTDGGKPVILVCCPHCADVGFLGDQHEVDPHGNVSPLVACDKCDHESSLFLQYFTPRNDANT